MSCGKLCMDVMTPTATLCGRLKQPSCGGRASSSGPHSAAQASARIRAVGNPLGAARLTKAAFGSSTTSRSASLTVSSFRSFSGQRNWRFTGSYGWHSSWNEQSPSSRFVPVRSVDGNSHRVQSGKPPARASLKADSVASRRIDELQRLQSPEKGSSPAAAPTVKTADDPVPFAGPPTETIEDSNWMERGSEMASTRPGVPVFVMLPLDTVQLTEKEGRVVSQLKRESNMERGLDELKKAGVEGVMVDVWWGLTERAPKEYDFSAYRKLFAKVEERGLKVQAVMSFHAAGGNVGDTCQVPLPQWVMDIGDQDLDIWYTDKNGVRNQECLSLGCDELSIFHGRTPVEMYHDFISAFSDEFHDVLGSCVTEVTVGMGPAGELRYPSYPEGDGRWRFPGVGEFQCYDKYMLEDLRVSAEALGHPEWGQNGGPHDAGNYNSKAWETGFFNYECGSWNTAYGEFFLEWYSGMLLQHADRVLGAAAAAMNRPGMKRCHASTKMSSDGHMVYEFQPACVVGAKLAGVHWWFKYPSHAAELTAGYYHTRYRKGYKDFMMVAKKHNARVHFTCVEMRDSEHPSDGRCSPEGLLDEMVSSADLYGVPLAGENALQRYDYHAFQRITHSAFGQRASAGRLFQVTFLRMGDLMFDNWPAFKEFLRNMRGQGF